MLVELNNFEEQIKNNPNLVLAKFFLKTCGPCNMLKPAIERLAEANPDIDIVDIDANIHYDICNDFQLSGVPAVLFFKNGELKAKIDGAQRMSDYQEKIDALK